MNSSPPGALNVVVNQELYEKLDNAETKNDETVACFRTVQCLKHTERTLLSSPNLCSIMFHQSLGIHGHLVLLQVSTLVCRTQGWTGQLLHTAGTAGSPCPSGTKRCGSHGGWLMGLWASIEAPSSSAAWLQILVIGHVMQIYWLHWSTWKIAERYKGFRLFDDHILDSEAEKRGAQRLSQLGGVNLVKNWKSRLKGFVCRLPCFFADTSICYWIFWHIHKKCILMHIVNYTILSSIYTGVFERSLSVSVSHVFACDNLSWPGEPAVTCQHWETWSVEGFWAKRSKSQLNAHSGNLSQYAYNLQQNRETLLVFLTVGSSTVPLVLQH